MRAVLPPFLSVLLSLLIFGLVGYDLSLMPRTTDTVDGSYAIYSVRRITIDGQWGHVLCLLMTLGIVALQVAQFYLQRVRAISERSNWRTADERAD